MLIDRMQTLKPEDSRSHIRCPFQLEQSASKMFIHFSYGPKLLDDRQQARELMEECVERYIEPERRSLVLGSMDRYFPLSNLITVSVDDPETYRGACHRHDPEQQLFLGESASSPGLTKGRLPSGLWSVTLSVHSIVTDTCEYRLRIWTEDPTTDQSAFS
ncbi:hypothetical protein [Cohnella zeiphila]|uniref:Uncharacterized protein n=1 Tax=Cohnella zeiphila TaxID=2761120 RepID=A0A7X0SQ77_9BACL|nr:hypothetical protein [Cohnella zeiphila]MBB6733049.1 hypothetical protein [Cohnella zeiphila]